jgi:FADH2-dependent halogenase
MGALAAGNDGARRFKVYEKRVFRAMDFYWEMVESFYTKPFMEVFMEPRNKFSLPDAITAILAGELEGGWSIYWRRKLFFWLIRIQARRPLVPRIIFREVTTLKSGAMPTRTVHELAGGNVRSVSS